MDYKIVYRAFLLVILLLMQKCNSISRKLNAKFLTSDDENCKSQKNTLLHIDAEGPNDSLHYLWNFIDNPSVLVALTNKSSKLNIKWTGDPLSKLKQTTDCLPQKISFNDSAIFSYGLSIKKIYEFNDANDNGVINSSSSANINVLNPSYFVWYIRNKAIGDETVELEMIGHSYNDEEKNLTRTGSITLLISVFGKLDRFNRQPFMLHSENTTQIDLSIDNFETNKTFTNSRFAIELLFVSDGEPDIVIPVNVKKTINDEHTPGIFKLVEINSPKNENTSMYLQWRPISYMTKERDVTDSTDVVFYPLGKSKDAFDDATNSILLPYYEENINGIIARKLNVSFGSNGDGFYKKTNYTSWTLLLGYSHSLDERFTSGTIILISNIIGLPFLLLILYSSIVYIRKPSVRE